VFSNIHLYYQVQVQVHAGHALALTCLQLLVWSSLVVRFVRRRLDAARLEYLNASGLVSLNLPPPGVCHHPGHTVNSSSK
jgi:hypothetical protein